VDVNEPEDGVARPHDALEEPAALGEGLVAYVVAVQREHVEREDGDRRPDRGPEPGARGVEVTPPGPIQYDELRVEDHVGDPEPAEGVDDLGQVPLDEVTAPGSHLVLTAGHAEHDAAPVELRLVRPAGPVGERARRRDELEADGAGHERLHGPRS